MSYEKQTWVTGEVITANKLNHMEDGIDNIMFVTDSLNELTGKTVLDKTFNQIKEAFESGKLIVLKIDEENEAKRDISFSYLVDLVAVEEDGSTPSYSARFGSIGLTMPIMEPKALLRVYTSTSAEGEMEYQANGIEL